MAGGCPQFVPSGFSNMTACFIKASKIGICQPSGSRNFSNITMGVPSYNLCNSLVVRSKSLVQLTLKGKDYTEYELQQIGIIGGHLRSLPSHARDLMSCSIVLCFLSLPTSSSSLDRCLTYSWIGRCFDERSLESL